MFRRKKRVRLHLVDEPGVNFPSPEGLLIRTRPDFELAVPRLIMSPGGNPAELDSKRLVVPRERVAFYEVL